MHSHSEFLKSLTTYRFCLVQYNSNSAEINYIIFGLRLRNSDLQK